MMNPWELVEFPTMFRWRWRYPSHQTYGVFHVFPPMLVLIAHESAATDKLERR